MGTFDSLNEAQSFVNIIQNKQGHKIACLEEISLLKKWITKKEVLELSNFYNNEYGEYLKSLI